MTKSERREKMPFTTSVVDDMRATFGELTGIHAEENGHTVNWGEPMTEGCEVVAIPSMAWGAKKRRSQK